MNSIKETAGNSSFGRFLSRRSVLQICSAGALAAAAGPVRAQEQETTWKRVLRTKTIRVGTIGTTKTSKVNLDGSFTGISPEILRQVLKPYGVTTLVPVQMDFASLIPALIANRVDVVANSMPIRKARCAQVAFSNPEFNAREGFGVLKGNPKNIHGFPDIAKNKDARLGFVVGGFQSVYADIAGIPKERVVTLPDQLLGLKAVADGRIDAFGTLRVLLVGFWSSSMIQISNWRSHTIRPLIARVSLIRISRALPFERKTTI